MGEEGVIECVVNNTIDGVRQWVQSQGGGCYNQDV